MKDDEYANAVHFESSKIILILGREPCAMKVASTVWGGGKGTPYAWNHLPYPNGTDLSK